MEFYASDAVFVGADGQRIVGLAAIRKLFAKVMQTYTSTISFEGRESAVSGDLAYDSGQFDETLVVNKTNATMHLRGTYLTVFRHQNDGWRIVRQVWTKQ